MDKILAPFRQSKLLNVVYISNILLSFHYYLVVYVNSSFLNTFFSETQISTLYIIGSIINTVLLLNISKILNKVGNFKVIVTMICIEILATIGLAVANIPFLIALYFILHLMAVPIILFNLDVFLEEVTTDESKTGEVRGIYLTLANITLVIAPTIVAFLLTQNTYWHIYALSCTFLIPLLYYVKKYLKDIQAPQIEHIKIRETILEYLQNKNLYNIFVSHFLLQLFYAYMIVYTPLYLQKYIGFSWGETGIMFTIMLLPFILFELPIGEYADKKYGEREFLTIGFIIMGLSTMFISFVTLKSFWIWTIILFITRIGASFVEITSDSFFFKLVDDRKTNIISFYRITRPLSFIIAPLFATLLLQFIPFQYTFIPIGALMIIGVHYGLALTYTESKKNSK